MGVISIIISVLFVCSCGSSVQFSTKAGKIIKKTDRRFIDRTLDSVPEFPENDSDRVSLDISCLSAGERRLSFKNGRKYLLSGLRLPYHCYLPEDPSGDSTFRKPMNLTFVIDISGSMSEGLSGIKKSISFLANTVRLKGWEARFSLISFRDDIFKTVAPTGVGEFLDEIQLLEAAGGGPWHPQEAGLSAIFRATDMLAENQDPEAKNILVYTSDTAAYFHDDQQFNTEGFVSELVTNYPETLKITDFYYAVPKQTDHPELVSPADQMKTLAGTFNKSQNLNFPLSEQVILGDLLDSIPDAFPSQGIRCGVSSLELSDSKGTLLKALNPSDGFVSGDSLGFNFEMSLENSVQLTISRCCQEEDYDKSATTETCPHTTKNVVTLNLTRET